MAKLKPSVWMAVFKAAVTSGKLLIKHPAGLRRIIEEAAQKMHKQTNAIREIVPDLQIIFRLVKTWLAGDYKEISLKSIAILIGAIVYFLNPFDAIPDVIPVVGYLDDVAVVGWVVKTLKDEIEKFRAWEANQRTV